MNSKAKKPDSLRPASPPPLPVVNSDTDRFNKAIRISLVIHGFLFIGSVFSHLFWGSNPKNYAPSVRVDLVGLPDLKKSDLNKAQANADLEALKKKLNAVDEAIKQEAAKAPRKPIEVVKKPEPPSDMVRKATMKEDRRKNLSSAIERIKALQAMEESVKKSEQLQVPARGNILSKGSQLTGDGSGDINEYVDQLVTKIRANWDLPLWLANQKLSAKVVLYINSAGGVAQIAFTKSSGNDQFDQFVRNTINRSSPFGPPPSDIASDGILLGFPL